MAKREEKPLKIISMFEYKGKVMPAEAFTPEDRRKAVAIATLDMMRVMNPGWTVELTEECRQIDLEAYFKDAPTVGSLYKTKEAQEKIDAEYARAAARRG